MSDHTRSNHFVLSTREALDYAITAVDLLDRDEAIAVLYAIRDHLDGAICGEASCPACRRPEPTAACTACGGSLLLWGAEGTPCFWGHPLDQGASR